MGRSRRADQVTGAAHVLARLARVLETACQEAELSLPQYRVLVFVHDRPERAGDVAAAASVSRPTLTALVDGLERQGMLRRTRVAGDGRGVRVELTPKGADALVRAEDAVRTRVDQLVHDAGAPAVIDGLLAVGEVLDQERAARQAERSSTANASHIRE